MKKDIFKYKNSPPRVKKKLDYVSKSKPKVKLPLLGKTVYLDVKEVKHVKRLQQDLKRLGGIIEEFLSKDINYLITTQPRPKRKNGDIEGNSPAPSPFNCDPSPSPGCAEDKKVPTVTRGKALAEKARVKARETNNLLDNAEKWGVRIVSLEGAYKWIEKELKKLPKPSHTVGKKPLRNSCVAKYKNFKAPFLKIEVSNFCYRPLHHELEVWPRVNIDTPRGSCPFDGTLIRGGDHSKEERGELLAAQVDIPSEDTPKEEKDGVAFDSLTPKVNAEKSTKKSEQESMGGSKMLTAGEIRRQRDQKRKQERKRGYCECCQVKYEDLDKHVRDDQHRSYIKDKGHYEKLDELIAAGPNSLQFISTALTNSVLMRTTKKSKPGEEEEISIIGDTPVKPSPSSGKGFSKSGKIQQVKTAEKEQKSTFRSSFTNKQTTNKDQDKVGENTCHVLKENTNHSPIKRQVEQCEDVAKDNGMGRREITKRTSPRKSVKDSGKDSVSNNGRSSKMLSNSCNVSEKLVTSKVLSPRKCRSVQDKENESLKDMVNIAEDKNLSTQELKSSPSKASPGPGRCLSRVFEQESKREMCQSTINKSTKKTSRIDENKVKDICDRKETVKNAPIISQSLSKARRSRTGTDENSKAGNKEIIKAVDDKLNNDESRLSKEQECKSKQTEAAGEVKAVMEMCNSRVQSNRSSDDFEVCLLRSVKMDQLTAKETVSHEHWNESEEIEVKRLSSSEQKNNIKKGMSFGKKEQKNRSQQKEENMSTGSKKQTNKLLNTDNQEMNAADKSGENEVLETIHSEENSLKNKSLIDIGEKNQEKDEITDCSDKAVKTVEDNKVASTNSFSDFQIMGPDGEMFFTKTLAERIKERSRSRPLDTSFGYSSSLNTSRQGYSLARSNSVSSIGTSMQTSVHSGKKPKKTRPVVSKKAKSRANIASDKVLSKYRNRREMSKKYESSQVGYQGDDERDGKDEINNDRRTTRRSGNLSTKSETVKDKTDSQIKHECTKSKRGSKFWYYVPEVAEDETDSKNSDAESVESCQETLKDKATMVDQERTKTKKGSKFWHYVPEITDEEAHSENNEAESVENCKETLQDKNNKLDKECTKTKKGSKFWYYVPEIAEEETDTENDSEYMSDLSQSLPGKVRRKTSKPRHSETKHNRKECEVETVTVNSNVLPLRNKTKTRNKVEVSYVEIDEERSEENSEIVEAGPVKKGQQKSKFWYYVPEVVEEENDSEKGIELVDSSTKNTRNETRKTRNDFNQVKENLSKVSSSEQENISSEVGEKRELEWVGKTSKDVSVKPEKKNRKAKKFWYFEPETVALNKELESEQTPLDRSRRQSKVAAAEKLKNTSQSWNDIYAKDSEKDSENDERSSSRPRRQCKEDSVLKTRNYMDDVGSDSDCHQASLNNSQKRSKIKGTKQYYKPEIVLANVEKDNENEQTHLNRASRKCKDEAVRRLSKMSIMADEASGSENEERTLTKSNTQDTYKETSKQVQSEEAPAKRSSKLGKFWYYVAEVSNYSTNSEEEIEILPVKLRTFNGRRHSVVSDISDSDTQHKSTIPGKVLKVSDSVKRVTDVKSKRSVKERTKQFEDDSESVNELKASAKSISGKRRNQRDGQFKQKEHKDTCQNKLLHNEEVKDRHKSKEINVEVLCDSGKRKTESSKWWEYVTFVEPASDGSDPCIPKELQLLKSPWNDLKVQSNGGKTRRRKQSLNTKPLEEIQIADTEVGHVEAIQDGTADEIVQESKNNKEFEKNTTDISKCNNEGVVDNRGNKQKTVNVGSLSMSPRQTVRKGSPTFPKTSSGNKKFKQKRKEKRNASPVFHYSPPSKRRKETVESEIDSSRRDSVVRSNVVSTGDNGVSEGTLNHSQTQHNESPIKNKTSNETSVDGKNSLATTPENKVTLSEPRSGYSATPREKRRKMWKRKKSDLSSAGVNSDSSCPEQKRRKLDKIKYIINRDSKESSASQKKKLEQMFERKDTFDNTESHRSSQFSLKWETSEIEKETSIVALDQTWSSCNERNVSIVGDKNNTLVSTNEKANDKDTTGVSREECSDISLVNDSEDECSDKTAKGKQSSNEEFDFEKFVPAPFSSPGKRSDSSWLDTCEDFIDKSLKKDSSLCYSYTSPWKSPMRKSKQFSDRTVPCSVECSTPKKQSATPKKNCNAGVEKIDQEIEFNFGSPQKNKQAFSPLRYKNGHVVDTSTSTPKCTKKLLTQPSFKCEQFSGLVFTGDNQESSTDTERLKEFRLLKKISSNKKKYNLSFDKSPTKKGGRKKVSI